MKSHLPGNAMRPHDTVGQRTLLRAIESNAALRPQHPFIEYGELTITHAAFADAVRRVANGLMAHGITHGQRVLAFLPNCPEYLVVRFAVQRIGAVFVTCSSLYVDDEIRYQLEASGAVLATRLMHSMKRDGCKRGIVTLCIGGGQGIALAIEMV